MEMSSWGDLNIKKNDIFIRLKCYEYIFYLFIKNCVIAEGILEELKYDEYDENAVG